MSSPLFRAHLGDDAANRFGSRIVRFVAPLVVTTPALVVAAVSDLYPTIDVTFPDDPEAASFKAAVTSLDDQLLAAADALGVDSRDYSPLVRGDRMKIKLSAPASSAPRRGSKATFVLRMDHVWFVGGRWGATWRTA